MRVRPGRSRRQVPVDHRARGAGSRKVGRRSQAEDTFRIRMAARISEALDRIERKSRSPHGIGEDERPVQEVVLQETASQAWSGPSCRRAGLTRGCRGRIARAAAGTLDACRRGRGVGGRRPPARPRSWRSGVIRSRQKMNTELHGPSGRTARTLQLTRSSTRAPSHRSLNRSSSSLRGSSMPRSGPRSARWRRA